ncbi:ATP-binding protein [Flavobacterium sp. SLB02]|uniref:ATP-binding protein n=1 Tax=Flavobacterium sp. SLB02 TaxID=2665645 RepID=UPI0012A9AE31|nr:AAA family ATPase [Flavobacterium sp. SLB02]QGK74419.1 AAA family ATPase [Flavobacterium sp. SLB02]
MKALFQRHISLVNQSQFKFERYLLNQLPWDQRLLGIKGARGVGKTTIFLQYIKKNYGLSSQALYVSLDNIYFSDNRLSDLVEDFVNQGGVHLFVDEVHKYPDWSVELKNIYDNYPNLKVAFTGSSLLEILNSRADLSRRALVFEMQGLSFREYLSFRHRIEITSLTLEDLLNNHTQIALQLDSRFKALPLFEKYLRVGYYPFYQENSNLYYKQLQEVINMILEIELPLLRRTDTNLIFKIKQLLYIISQSVPFKPNVSALANKIQVTRKTIIDNLLHLADASVINTIYKNQFGVSSLQKPEKIYLENTNFIYALSPEEPNIGNVRETFFLNQLRQNHRVTYHDKADFTVNEKYVFEIGGKNKSKAQIAGLNNAYIVQDQIAFGIENTIPLWLFGLLY